MRAALAWISLSAVCACSPPPAPEVPTAVVVAPEPAATAAVIAEPAAGKPVVVSQRLGDDAHVMELSPRGDLLLVMDGEVLHLIDVATGQTRGTVAGCIDSAAFSGDQRAVVTACQRTRQGRIWDLSTDTTRDIKFSVLRPELGNPPTGSLVVATGAGAVDVIDVARGTVQRRDTGKGRDVWRVHAAENGWMVATDAAEVTAFAPSGKVVRAIPKSRDATAFSLGSSGKLLALADTTGISIFDVESGRELPRITPCGDGQVDDVEWSEDEARLVVTCAPGTAPGRAVVLGADGVEEHELLQTPRGRSFVRPRGDRVAVTNPTLGVAVFEIASGRELFRVAPPRPNGRYLELTRDLERFLFRESMGLTGFSVLDTHGNVVNALLQPDPGALALGRVRGLLELRSDGNTLTYLDPISGEILRDVPGPLSPDGAVFRSLTNGLELVDRKTGAHHRIASEQVIGEPPAFSAGGAWLGVVAAVKKGRDVETVLKLYDTKTGQEGKAIAFSPAPWPVLWSPDDKLLAVHEASGARRCREGGGRSCLKLRVHDARTGRALTTLPVTERAGFLADGKHILVDDAVHDARTGRVAWKLPPASSVESPLEALPFVLLSIEGKWRFVEPDTGKLAHEADDVGEIRGRSADGRFFLATYDGKTRLWDTKTWTKRDTKLSLEENERAFVSDDGRFVFHNRGADLVVYRIEDGRSLRRQVPAFDFDVTDEGVFDPERAQGRALLVRRGPDVAKSPMGPLSLLAGELGHPYLAADFMAGKPVGRR